MSITKNNLNFSYKKPPLIIAEISGNHNGNKSRFLKLIEKACKSGADLIKIQTYEPEDITLSKRKKFLKIKKGIWKGKYFFDLYKKACTPYRWHHSAFKIAKKYKKIIFSSPFSIKAVDFLEEFNVPVYKIASFEITDYNLINYIASKKKPIIINTSRGEIVKEEDIIWALKNKVISGYGTDVIEKEFTDIQKSPIIKNIKKYNIIVTPHIGGMTHQGQSRAYSYAINKLKK